jgi:glycosyltransferase involved in cell wall biosynthesis
VDTISVVVPCFNEAEALPAFYAELNALSDTMDSAVLEVVFVDDGSTDDTLSAIKKLRSGDERIHYISLSRNFGKEAAMLAGLKQARGDYVAVADADMQDPIMLIGEMYGILRGDESWDCVATRRVTRKGEPLVRSYFARAFYKLINRISDTHIVDGARDFRIMRRSVVDAVVSLKESNRFSKGIFAWVGFRTKYLDYKNIERKHGKTKWSFWKLFAYSIDGILSFSTAPLVMVSIAGLAICVFAFGLLMYFLYQKIFVGIDIQGYAAMICIILFLGGIQLLGIGILGQYLAKVFIEVKNRPIYIIRECSNTTGDERPR